MSRPPKPLIERKKPILRPSLAVKRGVSARLGPMTGARAVLITGCSSGIGHATALRLARGGWTVYATARKPEALADLADAGCRTLALDVTDEESLRAAVGAIEGPLDALVNNAGYSLSGAVEGV